MSSSGGGGGGGPAGDGSVGPGERPGPARESLKISQIQGSSAGAGSGDFHTYRNARNIERERLLQMEKAAAEVAARDAFERARAITHFHLDAAAAKKAEKRKRKKAAKEVHEKRAKLDATNALTNDGSFMEVFLKKQAEAERAAAKAAAAGATAADATSTDTSSSTADTKASTDATEAAAASTPAPESKDASS